MRQLILLFSGMAEKLPLVPFLILIIAVNLLKMIFIIIQAKAKSKNPEGNSVLSRVLSVLACFSMGLYTWSVFYDRAIDNGMLIFLIVSVILLLISIFVAIKTNSIGLIGFNLIIVVLGWFSGCLSGIVSERIPFVLAIFGAAALNFGFFMIAMSAKSEGRSEAAGSSSSSSSSSTVSSVSSASSSSYKTAATSKKGYGNKAIAEYYKPRRNRTVNNVPSLKEIPAAHEAEYQRLVNSCKGFYLSRFFKKNEAAAETLNSTELLIRYAVSEWNENSKGHFPAFLNKLFSYEKKLESGEPIRLEYEPLTIEKTRLLINDKDRIETALDCFFDFYSKFRRLAAAFISTVDYGGALKDMKELKNSDLAIFILGSICANEIDVDILTEYNSDKTKTKLVDDLVFFWHLIRKNDINNVIDNPVTGKKERVDKIWNEWIYEALKDALKDPEDLNTTLLLVLVLGWDDYGYILDDFEFYISKFENEQ